MATGEGARGAAALLAGAELRGGARPEYAVSGVPGAIWDGVWPWSSIAAWVIHGCAQIRGFGARDMGAAAQAASLAGALPAGSTGWLTGSSISRKRERRWRLSSPWPESGGDEAQRGWG